MRAMMVAALAMVAMAAASGAVAQTGYGSPQYGNEPAEGLQRVLIGSWHMTGGGQPGSASDTFTIYQPNGTFQMAAYYPNGAAKVIQNWGQYTVQQTGPNTLVVQIRPMGLLPQQICIQGQGCRALPPLGDAPETMQVVNQNEMFGPGGMMQRSPVPPQLMQPQPATVMLAGPGPMPMPSPIGGDGGRYHTPYDPSAGNHGDIQQQRICAINNGRLVRLRDGSLKCMN